MKVALVGNPNSGKTSIFNQLTGLNQRVGNFPGITVDKKSGVLKSHGHTWTILDLPGIYSLYPKSEDEKIVFDVLSNKNHPDHPDVVVVVIDASNLERNLLILTQIIDLKFPVIVAMNMTDIAERKGLDVNPDKLGELLGNIKIVPIIARTGSGIKSLVDAIIGGDYRASTPFLEGEFGDDTVLSPNTSSQKDFVEARYKKIRQLLQFVQRQGKPKVEVLARHVRADRILTHKVWGYLIFVAILFVIFQAIFAWAEWPMNLIDSVFLKASRWIKDAFPEGVLTNLLAEGIVPGIGGIVIFIPQITLLFTFIFVLEESGYMSRVVFIMDRLMRPFGLNGRSVVPLISGVACAIPAIMATRIIDNRKERLLTIMVAPLMSCSARLPVYTLLIAIAIPDTDIGIFNLKGLVLLGLYVLGTVAALLVALAFKYVIKTSQKSFLVMELPYYKVPRWNNLGITLLEKVRVFVFDAGKVIFSISIILWVLASYGPGDRIEKAVEAIPSPEPGQVDEYERQVSSATLSNSYIGILGHAIEPVIRPLGYNWQIGIALITSFAAREVFVGSMATIYSVGDDFNSDQSLIQKMKNEKNHQTGKPVYSMASSISLMIFYAFAMQCMSTLAVTLRETKSWKYPVILLTYMTSLAYLSSAIVYQLLK